MYIVSNNAGNKYLTGKTENVLAWTNDLNLAAKFINEDQAKGMNVYVSQLTSNFTDTGVSNIIIPNM